MKNNLTTNDPIGWYECRFLKNPPEFRVARWWDGSHLFSTPHYSNTSCDSREYTEFVPLLATDGDDEPDTRTNRDKASAIVSWLGDQKYGGAPLLHAIVCCDYASQQHLIDAVARIIQDGTVYCHECSKAGSADRAIYHEPPICKQGI